MPSQKCWLGGRRPPSAFRPVSVYCWLDAVAGDRSDHRGEDGQQDDHDDRPRRRSWRPGRGGAAPRPAARGCGPRSPAGRRVAGSAAARARPAAAEPGMLMACLLPARICASAARSVRRRPAAAPDSMTRSSRGDRRLELGQVLAVRHREVAGGRGARRRRRAAARAAASSVDADRRGLRAARVEPAARRRRRSATARRRPGRSARRGRTGPGRGPGTADSSAPV